MAAPIENHLRRAAVQRWKAVGRLNKGPYAPLTDFTSLPNGDYVEYDSRRWTSTFLQPAADPYQVPNVQRSILPSNAHQRFDTVRHEYSANGLSFTYVETRNLATLRVTLTTGRLLSESSEKNEQTVIRVLNQVVRTSGTATDRQGLDIPYSLVFKHSDPIQEGTLFSTEFHRDFYMGCSSWAMCVDGRIRRGALELLFLRIIGQDGTEFLPDDRTWFEGDKVVNRPFHGTKPKEQ